MRLSYLYLGLLDELLQVGAVLESVLAVLQDGHHVPGQIVLGGHPDPPLSSPQTGLQGVSVYEIHGADFLAAAVQDGFPVNIKVKLL